MPDLYVGLISGTSMDAADAVLLDLSQADTPRIQATHAEPLPAGLRDELLPLAQKAAAVPAAEFGALDRRLGDWFAEAALALLVDKAGVEPEAVRGIGSHGQTVHHAPDAAFPFSLQLGDPGLIAARTGIATVGHLRGADIAAGGQGAPLVPAFHHRVFRDPAENRAVLNLGGIANLTLLPASDEDGDAVTGFDTGPGNALMDAWAAEHLDEPRDTDGRWAATGRVNEALLDRMLRDPYFRKSPPKSTGREYFHLTWLRERLDESGQSPAPADVQRTLCELAARGVAAALDEHGPGGERVLLCGGGAHNPLLRERLQALLAPRPVADTGDYGIAVDWVEAAAFAWLAMRTLAGLPGNLPSVTGAREAVVLGGIYNPKPYSP